MANDAIASTSPDYNSNGGVAKVLDDFHQRQVLSADGAITIKSGVVLITKGTACAATLAAPTAGAVSAGGDDGKVLIIRPTVAAAHTVTTPANKINTNKLTATFAGAALTEYQQLVAYNGVWYSMASAGSTLS
jgi:hypothetical protein